ncbi:MAG: NUDIX hydrolase [Patescibacteria group bacterium]
MEIKSQYEYHGRLWNSHYVEGDPNINLNGIKLNGVHCICFYGDKIVIVYEKKKSMWSPPGGAIEPGETYEEASIREVMEESNMKVLYQETIGYQDVNRVDDNLTYRQARMFCIVEPYSDFVVDPDGDITEIKLIDSKDYKQYFDWGESGDRILERALEIKASLKI